MKMKTVLSLFCVLGFAGWCLWSCNTIQSYSEIPEIHFVSLSFEDVITNDVTDNMAILIFSFIDGDGDIGVRTIFDSISKIHYTWYKKLPDRTYEAYQFPRTGTINDSTVIPYNSVMNKDDAQNKTLNGTIQIALYPPSNPQDVDTMRIEYHIFDRAGHKSNVDYTPDFSILNTSEPIKALGKN
jgi:hypothetical protein